MSNPNGCINKIKTFKKQIYNTKYTFETYPGNNHKLCKRLTPTPRTHLEKNDGSYCDKETFIHEFEKYENEISNQITSSTASASTIKTFLNEFLNTFDNDGLAKSDIDKRENYDSIKI